MKLNSTLTRQNGGSKSRLQLTGWDCFRRAMLYRRAHRLKAKPDKQTQVLPEICAQGELTALELLEEDSLSYEYPLNSSFYRLPQL